MKESVNKKIEYIKKKMKKLGEDPPDNLQTVKVAPTWLWPSTWKEPPIMEQEPNIIHRETLTLIGQVSTEIEEVLEKWQIPSKFKQTIFNEVYKTIIRNLYKRWKIRCKQFAQINKQSNN